MGIVTFMCNTGVTRLFWMQAMSIVARGAIARVIPKTVFLDLRRLAYP